MSETTAHGDSAIHRQSLRGYETENTYGGVPSFMRRRCARDLTGVDVAVTGARPDRLPPTGRAHGSVRPRSARPRPSSTRSSTPGVSASASGSR